MNLKQLIIAFLAPRDPAAYPAAAIAQRINTSRMLDRRCTVDEVENALRSLHKMEMVGMNINKLDDSPVWQITPNGFQEWAITGKVTVV